MSAPGLTFIDATDWHDLDPGESISVAAPTGWNVLVGVEIEVDPDCDGPVKIEQIGWGAGVPQIPAITMQPGDRLKWGFSNAAWPFAAKIKASNPGATGDPNSCVQITVRGKSVT